MRKHGSETEAVAVSGGQKKGGTLCSVLLFSCDMTHWPRVVRLHVSTYLQSRIMAQEIDKEKESRLCVICQVCFCVYMSSILHSAFRGWSAPSDPVLHVLIYDVN